MIKFRNPYNYDTDIASFQSGVDFSDDPGLTQQHMKDETDINVIVDRFLKTGQMPPDIDFAHVDVSEVGDFHDALNVVRAAQEQFDQLPSRVRERFHNEPAALMRFVHDDNNRAEALALGLLRPAEPPPEAPPAPPTPAPSGEHTPST